MSIWNTISALAHRLLGENAPKPRILPEIERKIIPEQGKPRAKPYSSERPPLGDIEILPEYQFILEALKIGCPSIFVTGKAGTGKSTLIQWLCGQLDACAVVAPTAIAAMTVGGDTIHSFFGLPPEHLDPDETYRPSAKSRLVMENLKFLIIDEVSMVLPNVVDVMSHILQSVRSNSQPFGGVPTIFVGDLLQLPPVVSTPEERVYFSHRYSTPHFFVADVFQSQPIQPVNLAKVRRQVDEEFVEALNRIRLNDQCRDAVALFNRRCYRDVEQGSATGVYLVPTNQAAKSINTRELSELAGETRTYEATVTGNLPANRWKLAVSDRLELKVGAKVIFLKNRKPSWINGDIGIVVGMEDEHIRVRKEESDNVLVVSRETWTKYKYTYDYQTRRLQREEVGTFEQFPVALGWAITIHKSQGLTLDKLTLDLGGGAFCEGQTYVALSRARTIDGIRLERPISMRDVRADQIVVKFYEELGVAD